MINIYQDTLTRRQKFGIFLLSAVVFILIVSLADFRNAAATFIVYAGFTLPGILICRKNNLSSWRMFIYGVPIGLGLTSFVVIVVVSLVGWRLNFIIVSWVIFICFICFYPFTIHKKNNKDSIMLNDTKKGAEDIVSVPPAILILITFFTLLVYIPLSKVGVLTEYGYAFTGLFSHDFILRALDAVAMANSIPPENYFFGGEITKNYYLLWYVLPATVYNMLGFVGNIREIVAVICILNVPFFLLIFYFTLKDFLGSRLSIEKSPLVFFLVVYCTSYHWLFVAAKNIANSLHINSADKIFFKMHAVSQTWYRDLIFEPHCILALMLVFCLFALSKQPASIKRGFVTGILLSLIALTDTAIFLIVGSWYFFCMMICMIHTRKIDELYDALSAAGVGLGVVVLMFALGVFGVTQYSNKLIIQPSMFVIVTLPLFLILNYGVTAVTWLSVFRVKELDRKWQLLLLALVSVFFMMFITESLEGNVVLRKALKVGRISFALLAGYYLCCFAGSKLYRIIILLFLLSLPTFFSDISALTNVNDIDHTSYISKDDMEAALWIKNNTPNDAFVQGAIDYPGYFDFSLTACFGERRSALSHWKMAYQRYPNLISIKQRVKAVDKLFQQTKTWQPSDFDNLLPVDYVVLGKNELKLYPESKDFYKYGKGFLEPVFSNRSVFIYKVQK
jgi:hypothetical protein